MCQDLTSWVSTLSNRILQHVDLQNTTDGLPLSRPSHMECNKHDNAAHSNMATRIHVHTRTQTHIHTGIYCWMHSSTHTQKRSHKQHVARCRRAQTDQPFALIWDWKRNLLFLTSLWISKINSSGCTRGDDNMRNISERLSVHVVKSTALKAHNAEEIYK